MVSEYIARGINGVRELATRAYTTYQTNNWVNAAVNTGLVYGALKATAWATGALTSNQGLEDLIDMATPVATGIVAAQQTNKIAPDSSFAQDAFKVAIGAATVAGLASELNNYGGPSQVVETLSDGTETLQRYVGSRISQNPTTAAAVMGGVAAFLARIVQNYNRLR